MKLKTYGVSGLMDWTTNIKVGKASVSVHFTGGALTAYGVTPAKYSTSNPFFQSVIEGSLHFKSGRIALLGEMEVADDAAAKARKARKAAKESRTASPSPPSGSEGSVAPAAEAVPTDAPLPTVTTEAVAETAAEAESPTVRTVEVADKNEAVEYLKEHYNEGYTATQLRSKAAFAAACTEHGVKFVFA